MNQVLDWHLDQEALRSIVEQITSGTVDGSTSHVESNVLDAAMRTITGDQLRSYFSTAAMQSLESWVREFAADAFALHTCGPAYFFALADFTFSNEDPALHSDTHPASGLRLRRLMKMLEKMGYFSEPRLSPRLRERLDEWKSALPDIGPQRPVHLLVVKSVTEEQLDRMEDLVKSATTLEPYTAERFVERVPRLSERLLDGLLPNEDRFQGRIATMFDIFNAAWDVTNSLPDFEQSLNARSKDERAAAARNLNELILKAVQMADVRGWWDEKRREGAP